MSKNQEYAQQYAEYAMEQMKKYGIPASVTLAQGILESSNGKSQLARNENNHFGIKATSAWIEQGGKYGLYSDDKPNEKFCSYESVADSYEHHSKFLKENSRYAECFKLSPDDYKGWTETIAKAGYASGKEYATQLQRIIEINGLDKYDKMVMEQKALAVSENKSNALEYSFPLEREEYLFITSPFGSRKDPLDSTKEQMHQGIDIRCNFEKVLSTENNGKVVSVNHNAQSSDGKSITVEYERENGKKVQLYYSHLSEINVKVGDIVNAGTSIGISGNSGTRTTGPHLHFSVKNINADGTSRSIDPTAYLSEIAQKGNIKLQALHNGKDLLAKYTVQDESNQKTDVKVDTSLTPDNWMKKLLSSEDSGLGLSNIGDPIMNMVVTAFSSLMMLAVQIDNKNDEEKKSVISNALDKQSVDLTPIVPNMKTCVLTINNEGKAILKADNGITQLSRELTSSELSRLSANLTNPNLTEETKGLRVSGMISGLLLSQQASQNFEKGMSEHLGQTENLKR